MADVKVQIVSRDDKGATFRLPDGTEKYVSGEKIGMVYCAHRDIDDAIKADPDPDVLVDFTMTPSGQVLCFGLANRI